MPVEKCERFEHTDLADLPSQLHVESNLLRNEQDVPVRLRGLIPVDPHELGGRKLFDRDFFEGLLQTTANAVRIPLYPHTWTETDE